MRNPKIDFVPFAESKLRKTMKLGSILILLLVKSIAGQVIIREVKPIPAGESILLSPKENTSYPTIGVDIIWKLSEPIDLKIKSFSIDFQIGDFLLLSKFPFPSISGDLSPERLINLLPLGQGIVLTGNVQSERTFRLVPETQGFLYFHGEYGNRHPSTAGFSIEISPFDKEQNTAPTSTESSITTPIPSKENFVQKFINGKEPYLFIKGLEKFKSAIADITNSYCEQKNIPLSNEATSSDVKIPYEEIRFCDRGWPKYLTCVEVNFAISVYDTSFNYVMTVERIHELWNLFCPELGNRYGFFCYEPPPNPESPTAWIWIAISLSVILIFSLILCLAWIKKTSDELQNMRFQAWAFVVSTLILSLVWICGWRVRKTHLRAKSYAMDEQVQKAHPVDFHLLVSVMYNSFQTLKFSDSEIAKAINDTVEDEENFYDRKNPIKDVLRTIIQGKSEKDAFVNDLMQQQRNSSINQFEENEGASANKSTFTYHNQLFESDGFTSSSSESEDEDINEYERNDFSRPATFEAETSESRLRRHSPNENTNGVDTLY